MKFIFTLLLVISMNTFGQTIQLNWKFLHPIKNQWVDAGTHGSVQQSLIASGELPDPFYGLNENLFGWIEEQKWEFVSIFNLTENQLDNSFIELEFPGIDTYASIYLNDTLLFKSENNFKPYRFQVKRFAKLGENKLKAIFTPPTMYHAARFKNEKFHYPATNDVGKIAVAPYTRKPQYQFGWDWALRMNTIGFLKPVEIYCYNESRILGKNCITQLISEENASLDFQLFLTEPIKKAGIWRSKLFGDYSFSQSTDKVIHRTVSLKNPKLWWPRGQGDQSLYLDEWILLDEKGNLIDSMTVQFGIRKTELVMEPDQWGTSYVIKVNDRPIFCKGGDYIPQDIFPTRVKDADIRKMVEAMAESNFNMVRVWGGGYYPDEVFFNACDELGIMVWQDLMFACAMYPGDSAFLANVKGEFEYQIPRIASHPSLVLFNGNNEVDVAWKNWGFQSKYGIYGADAKQVEDDYDRLFKKLAPTVISSFTNSPYVHTSPLSNWGKDEYYNHGTMHYWGVWHGKDPIEDFGKKSGRFNAEYGFQSFPEFSTLNTFSKPADWDLESKVMKHHQKSYVGNGMILKQATMLYGKPTSFEEFVYFSQLTQSKAISIAVASHRIGMPRCMGTLYWQVNDCWQAPTWSSIDYFGNWKALHYAIKKDYSDVTVLSKIEEIGKDEYYLVSDLPDSFVCQLKYTLTNLYGKVLETKDFTFQLKPGIAHKISGKYLLKEEKDKGFVVHFEWNTPNQIKQERTFSHTPKHHLKTHKKDVSYSIEEVDTVKKTLKLVVSNSKFVQDFWVTSLKLGVHYSDNFMNLLPGKHTIEISYSGEKPALEDFKFFWR